jgi:predicted transcriptional regulator
VFKGCKVLIDSEKKKQELKKRKRYSVLHSKNRIKQRYGIKVTENEVITIGNRAKYNKAEKILKLSENKKLCKTTVNDKVVYFIYNKNCKRISTFITEDHAQKLIEKERKK